MSDAVLSQELVNARVATIENHGDLSPVKYAYDWLKNTSVEYLKPTPPVLSWDILSTATPSEGSTDVNAFDVFPRLAGLPWPTGFPRARQSRHWKAALSSSTEALEVFAKSADMSQIVRADGKSMAKVAAQHLLVPEEDRFTKFPIYLFPLADEERAKLLGVALVFATVFDDLWETHEAGELESLRNDFVQRLQGSRAEEDSTVTELQKLIDSTVSGFRRQDTVAGNGGQEVIDRIVDYSMHLPPQSDFKSFDEYLKYRYIDAAVPFLIAGAKFSIGSNVCIDDPKLTKIRLLAGDHISLVNDLASFDKELREFEKGELRDLVNSVNILRKLLGLPSWSVAKAFTYAMQLEVETQIKQELENLVTSNTLDTEQRRFVQALMIMLAGNVFYSMVASRYGGEKARVPS